MRKEQKNLKFTDLPDLFHKSCKVLPLQWKAHAKKIHSFNGSYLISQNKQIL